MTELLVYSISIPNAAGEECPLPRSNFSCQPAPGQINPAFEAVPWSVWEHCNHCRHSGLAWSVRIPDLPLGRIWVQERGRECDVGLEADGAQGLYGASHHFGRSCSHLHRLITGCSLYLHGRCVDPGEMVCSKSKGKHPIARPFFPPPIMVRECLDGLSILIM